MKGIIVGKSFSLGGGGTAPPPLFMVLMSMLVFLCAGVVYMTPVNQFHSSMRWRHFIVYEFHSGTKWLKLQSSYWNGNLDPVHR